MQLGRLVVGRRVDQRGREYLILVVLASSFPATFNRIDY